MNSFGIGKLEHRSPSTASRHSRQGGDERNSREKEGRFNAEYAKVAQWAQGDYGAPFGAQFFVRVALRSLRVLRVQLPSRTLGAEVEAQAGRGREGREKNCSKRSRGEKEERAARQSVDRGAHRAGAEDDDGRQERHHDEGQDEDRRGGSRL